MDTASSGAVSDETESKESGARFPMTEFMAKHKVGEFVTAKVLSFMHKRGECIVW